MIDKIKTEFNNGMPVITFVKKNYGFSSVEEFQQYVAVLQEKAAAYDKIKQEGSQD